MNEIHQGDISPPSKLPTIRPADMNDLKMALVSGIRDYVKAPTFGLFFGGIYALGGLFILYALIRLGNEWMIIPVAIGFPLIGPFVAVGLYEVSRRLQTGMPLKWRDILLVIYDQRERQIGWFAFIVLFIFWIWIYQVRLLLALFLASKSFSSLDGFLEIVTTTPEGLAFLAIGTIIGAVLACVLYCTTVISLPLLIDHDVDFVTAMITSFRAVFASPVVMLTWGVIVSLLTIVAMLPAFLGLVVVLPVLGYATWHLYALLTETEPRQQEQTEESPPTN